MNLQTLRRTAQGESVAFFYKPETKYPARIYVLFEYEDWTARKVRPMCLTDTLPFFRRPMNEKEKQYVEGKTYLCFFSFQLWSDFEKHIERFHSHLDQGETERLKLIFPLTNKVNLNEQRKQYIDAATERAARRKTIPVRKIGARAPRYRSNYSGK